MILPKDFFNKLDYFEYVTKSGSGYDVYDVYTFHFKAWWRPKKVIKFRRNFDGSEGGKFSHSMTDISQALYDQLYNWARSTWEDNTSVEKKEI